MKHSLQKWPVRVMWGAETYDGTLGEKCLEFGGFHDVDGRVSVCRQGDPHRFGDVFFHLEGGDVRAARGEDAVFEDLDVGEAVLSKELFKSRKHEGGARGRLLVEGHHAAEQLGAPVCWVDAVAEAADIVATCIAVDLDELEAIGVDVLGLDPRATAGDGLGVVPFCHGPEVQG